MGKRTVFFALLISIMVIGLFGCVNKGKQVGEKEKALTSLESIAVSTQGWKTHVSKYGFSVSYPKDWFLEEIGENIAIPQGHKGYLRFMLANKDTQFYLPRTPENIELKFDTDDVLDNSPVTIQGKLDFYARHFGMQSIDDIQVIKHANVLFYLTYGVPRGDAVKYEVLYFFLPKPKRIGYMIVHNRGPYSIDELLDKVKIKISE